MKKRKLLAFELEFSGQTRKEIEAITRYRENTLNAYFAKNGLWRAEYDKWAEDYGRELHHESRIRIIRATTKAIDVLEASLAMVKENPSVAQRAAMAILDYAGISRNPKNDVAEVKHVDQAEEIMKWFENRRLGLGKCPKQV